MMTTTNGGQAQTPPPPGLAPQLNVVAQYIKDLSFENPNAPQSMGRRRSSRKSPSRSTSMPSRCKAATSRSNSSSRARPRSAANLMFRFELVYGGVFRLQNVPQEALNPILLIECPRLLFPFAREIIAATVRNGGFPPLLLDPVDFVGLYRKKLGEMQTAGAPPASQP